MYGTHITETDLLLTGAQRSARLVLRALLAAVGGLILASLLFQSAHAAEPTPVLQELPITPAAATKSGLWVKPESKSASAGLEIDSAGNMHMLAVDYVPLAEHPKVIYSFCPAVADCGKPGNWKSTSFSNEVIEAQLAVTSDGRPRILFRRTSTHQVGAKDWYYGECESSCTSSANWKLVFITTQYGVDTSDVFEANATQRSFALDNLDRPRFSYQDRNYPIEPDHYGHYYLWCDANCTEHTAQNPTWFEVELGVDYEYDAEIYGLPSLKFTSDNKPRMIADVITLTEEVPDGIYYIGCDANCGNPAAWRRVYIAERGSGTEVSFDLELTSKDMPRIAFYEGSFIGGEGEELLYGWCNGNCFVGDSWTGLNLGLGSGHGESPDLELTAAEQPRIGLLYNGGSGLVLAQCDGGCETGGWSAEMLEPASELDAEFPVPRPSHCDAGFWDQRAPMMALGKGGHPVFAYDAGYETRCLYDDPNDGQPPYMRFHQLRHNVRFVMWSESSGGGTPGSIKSWLPMVGN